MDRFFTPDWDAPRGVRAVVTMRTGGVSAPPWSSFDLADHVGDDPVAVAANRALLRKDLPSEPVWLKQVHGTTCVDAAQVHGVPEADASFTRRPGVVCVVMTADCLPVFFCNAQASVVAVAHAGWRGLAAGILEATVAAMAVPTDELHVWFGPAIGPRAFEVGADVRDTYLTWSAAAGDAFVQTAPDRWHCDIYQLARLRLRAMGMHRIAGGGRCTVAENDRFFSFRRDGVTGRMASCIWLETL